MGIELAAQYAENKLGKDFEALAFEYVLSPLGISDISMGRRKPWLEQRLATPMSTEGEYFDMSDSSNRLAEVSADGPWSGADDLLTTVEAYARFLIGVINNSWVSDSMAAERTHIITSLKGDEIWNCDPADELACAHSYGHGIGWMVYEFEHKTVVKHGGNDAGENALVMYSPETRDGAVILVNGGNGIFVVTQILTLLGEEPEIAAYYRQLVEKFYAVELPDIATGNAAER